MAYVTEQITSISDDDLNRIIGDTLQKAETGSTYPFKVGTTEDEKKNILKVQLTNHIKNNYAFGIKKDNLLITIFAGTIDSGEFTSLMFFVSRDANGSRSFLYDNGWISQIKIYMQSQSDFTVFNTLTTGTGLSGYHQNIVTENKFVLTIENESTDSADGFEYQTRKITF
jgi:hypothetical protein